MSYEKPYEGLKVIDFSQGVAGTYCGMLLAQYGAEVIKVEPKDGDWARNLGQEYGQHSAFSVTGNMGKKSIVFDLKNQTTDGLRNSNPQNYLKAVERITQEGGYVFRIGTNNSSKFEKKKNLIDYARYTSYSRPGMQ